MSWRDTGSRRLALGTLDRVTDGSLEDERGVDRWAIRQRLKMTPAERVEQMVREVRVWTEIRESATRSPE